MQPRRPCARKGPGTLDFSVVVPTFNRPRELAGCLAALGALDYSRGAYEVIVVDDGGTPDLSATVEVAGGRLLRQPNRGPGAARNAGAQAARGRWLAFTDDDCRPYEGWLTGLAGVLARGTQTLAGGRTVNALPSNPFAEASQIIIDGAYRYFNPDLADCRFLASNNMGVARAAFLAADGFDESFRIASEDREFCDRWRSSGGRIVWTPAATVGHRHDMDFRAFLRQHYRYGRGAAQFHRTRKFRGTGGIWNDTSFRWRAWDLVIRPALAASSPVTQLALLACWQAANTAGFLHGVWSPSRDPRPASAPKHIPSP